MPAERSPPQLVPVPKANGTRWLTLLDPVDEAEFRATVAPLAPRLDGQLQPGVIANRLRPASRSWFEPWRSARSRFRSLARERLAQPGMLVLRTDVRECFGRIRPEIVEQSLLRAGCHPSEIGAVRRLLDRFAAAGVPGLPIGPQPSAVLAGSVLAYADEALAHEHVAHLRWVDDFLVFSLSEAHARRALDRLHDALGRLGLDIAAEKTHILDGCATRAEFGPSLPCETD